MKFSISPFTTLLALTGLIAPATAQRPATAEGGNRAGSETRPAASIASVTQNMKRSEGFYTFYYDEKTGRIMLELDRFDQEFLYFSSLPEGIGNGGAERGQASAVIAKFIRVGPKVFLLQPNYSQRSVNGNADMQKDVEDGFSQSILFGFSPVAVEGDKLLIDATPFIVRDALHIGENIGSGRGNPGSAFSAAANAPGRAGAAAGGGYRLDESRSAVFMGNTKNFPKNTEFEALVTFAGGTAGGAGGGFRRGGGVAPDPTSVTV
ncbi:MAG TPA: DUF5117 domain-containing protein, partial [Puia sp.]|nr:DUF5117 domain-containing protein [Puia sp.]